MREGDKPKEKNLMGLFVGYEFLLDLLFAEPGDNRIYINKIKDIPEDAKLINVRETWEKQGFVFILEHSSFPIVDEGSVIPVRNLRLETDIAKQEGAED